MMIMNDNIHWFTTDEEVGGGSSLLAVPGQ